MGRLGVADIAANIADSIIDVPVGDDQIKFAVKIEIGKTASETERGLGRSANTRGNRDIFKLSGRRRTVKTNHFIIKISDGDAGAAGIFKVADVDAHSGAGFAVSAKGESCFDGDVLEFSVALIVEQ